jgi:glycosyltransferase involved in cell wall biosynthesis
MRFSVDAHSVGCHLTGNEVYIRNLLNEFAKLDRSSQFIAYVSKPDAGSRLPAGVATRWVSQNPFRRLGMDLPLRLREDRPDLLHVQYTGPLFSRVPLVVSVHDVSFLEHPQYFTRFRATQLKITVRKTAERAAAILTPSEFSRTAILRHYRLDERKVVVVHNAVASEFRPIDRHTAQASVLRKFGVPGPFVLMVGDLQPRKNHLGLLKAFEEVVRAHSHLKHRLVFVGKETWYSKDLHRAVQQSGIAERVYFTGFVEDADLVEFYGACDLFVFPSFYEGFGLPILEAMACGRAVASSNTTAMPEVADAAGLLFDPGSTEQMARAIRDILLDPELRIRLERLGSHRASLFTWERAAERTLEVYARVAGGKAKAMRAAVRTRV